jgi:hypothetical protein
MTPAWLLEIVAAVMLAVAALSAARLVAARPWARDGVVIDTDVAHLLMAIAMAGMLTPGLRTLPDAAWEVIFGLLAAWFAVRVTHDARRNGVRALAGGHCAPHLVHSASMLYMALAITATVPGGTAPVASGTGGMAMSGTSAMTLRYPTLALLFAFILVGYSIWDLDQLSGRRYTLASARVSVAKLAVPGIPLLAGADSADLALPFPVASRDSASAPGPQPEAVRPTAGGRPAAVADEADRRAVGDHAVAGLGTWLLSPAITVGCRIAMGIAMAFMLFIAI